MGTGLLTTNLNQSPYFDDTSANSAYYRFLFKPLVAVQARELTGLQTLLQNQITQFGENILTEGTIVKGCTISFSKHLAYVKVLDTYANGTALSIADLQNQYALSNSGLKAFIYNNIPGFVSQAPNLNTLYIKYLNSSTNNSVKTFQNDEVLTIVTSANIALGKITVANTASSGSSNTTGLGYSVSVGDGVIFQKGIFLNVVKQTLIVSPYSNLPDGISVGFTSPETIVTAFQDPSLLDNAQGSGNYAAPGADRLELTPQLTVVNTNAITNNFFSIVNFVGGGPSIINQDTSYSVIGKKMANISDETNGSFVITPFNVRLLQLPFANGAIDSNNIKLEIDGGEGYIKGYNVNLVGKLLSVIPKAITSNAVSTQILSAQLGNFVTVNEVAGSFNPNVFQSVSLRSAAAFGVSNNLVKGTGPNAVSPPGSQIGTASLLAIQYASGEPSTQTSQYDFFLFNVQMTSNNPFSAVKSVYANNATVIGLADIVLTNNAAILQQSNFTPYVYAFNQAAIRTLKTGANTVDTQFQYFTTNNVTFANTGNVSITVPSYTGGINQLPFGSGPLSTLQMGNFIVTIGNTVQAANIAGTVTVAAGNTTVNGLTTVFSTALYNGALLTIANSTVTETKQILSIANNTKLTTVLPYVSAFTTCNAYITLLNGQQLPLGVMGANVNIVNTSTFTISLGKNYTTPFNASVNYDIQRTTASPIKKNLQTSVFVLINCSTNPGGAIGPWCLGVPDVFAVKNVYVGTTYAITNPKATSNFSLNNGQNDTFYGLSYLNSKGATLTASSRLVVEVEAYTADFSHGAGFFSVDSYPIDDTGVSSNSIFTQDIQTYNSAQGPYNLRNSMDFRFYATNTIPYVSNATLAVANTVIIDPSNAVAFSTTNLMLPVPDSQVESSLQFYLGRYDKVGLTTQGGVVVNQGTPAENPVPPNDITFGMTVATMYIPPYPSITVDINDSNMANNYPKTSISYNTNRRYTMADIGGLDARLKTVEYYTALSLLEQSAQNLLLTNGSGATRFQNGILADPMDNFSIANTTDPAFNIAIDSNLSLARPTFSQLTVQLQFNNAASNNVALSNNGRLVTLIPTQQASPIIAQPFSSQIRNCVQDTMYTWRGVVTLSPEGNWQPDVTVNPAVVVSTNDYANWVNLANAWNTQWGTWNETNTSVTSTSGGGGGGGAKSAPGGGSGGSTTTTTTTLTSTQMQANRISSTQSFGNVVTSVALQPFCQPQAIQVTAYGLKPNTQFWPFFNDISISQYCLSTNSTFAIGTSAGGPLSPLILDAKKTLISDANGNLYAWFFLPGSTFYTGKLLFQVIDVQNLATGTPAITSMASTSYYGTNLAYTQNALKLKTTTAQLALNTLTQTLVSNTYTPNTTIYSPVGVANGYSYYPGPTGSPGGGTNGNGTGGAPGGGAPGGPGSGGTVICTHFYHTGFINKEEYWAEVRYNLRAYSPQTLRGYRFWAVPYVKIMRKSKLAESVMKIIFRAWLDEVLYRAGKRETGSLLGKVINGIGHSMSYVGGLVVKERDYSHLWIGKKILDKLKTESFS